MQRHGSLAVISAVIATSLGLPGNLPVKGYYSANFTVVSASSIDGLYLRAGSVVYSTTTQPYTV